MVDAERNKKIPVNNMRQKHQNKTQSNMQIKHRIKHILGHRNLMKAYKYIKEQENLMHNKIVHKFLLDRLMFSYGPNIFQCETLGGYLNGQ